MKDKSPTSRSEGGDEPYSLFFDHNPLPMWVYDVETYRFLAVNHAAVKQYGYSEAEFKAMTIKDIRPPEDVVRLVENVEHITAGFDQAGIWRHIQKDGSLIYVEIVSHTLSFDGRNAELVVVMDVTARIRTEWALRASEAQFRNVFENSPVGKSMTGMDGTLKVNKAFCNIVGYSEEELQAKNWKEITHPDDIPKSLDVIQSLLDGRVSTAQFEKRYIHKNGAHVWVEVNTALQRDDNGNPLYFLTTIADITERKQADQSLRASEERYHDLVENIHDLICTHDLEGVILSVNRAATDLLGYAREEIIGKNLRDFLAPDVRHHFGTHLSTIRKRGAASGLMNVQSRSGEIRVWEYHNTLRREGVQEPIVRGYARDVTEQKQAEQALRASQAQLQGIINSAMDAIITMDEDQRIVAFNPAAEQMFKCPAREVVGGPLDRFIPEYYRARHRASVAAFGHSHTTKRAMQTPALALTCLRADGEMFQSEISISQLKLDGRTLYTAVVRDATERRRADEKLRASEEKYRRITENAMDIIFRFELVPEMKLSYINAAVLNITGYTPEECLADPLLMLNMIHPDDLPQMAKYVETRAVPEQPLFMRWLAKDGSVRWMESRIVPVCDESGQLSAVEGITRDMTERKDAEDKIRRQMERLSALHEIDLAITSTFDLRVSLNTLLSRTLKHLSVDAAAVLLLNEGLKRLEYGAGVGFRTNALETGSVKLGESYAGKVALERRIVQIPDLAHAPDNPSLTGCLKGEDFVSYYGAPLVVKGRVIGVLEVFSRSLMERNEEWFEFYGTLAGQAAIAVDNAQLFSTARRELMERRLAEEELRKLNTELEARVQARTAELERAVRVKDEFLANMSHELRTPLNAIIGLSESLEEQTVGPLNEKQQKYIGTIRESGGHLLELINDILDIAKIEAGQITFERLQVDVRAVCQSSLRMVNQLAQKKAQQVTFEADERLDQIWADGRRLKQMLVNLLSNAVKFTPEQGRIGLEARGNWEENTVTFTVWDTGIGIKEEDLARLFRPFVQLDAELSRKTGGTGLGLALVAQMARLQGGSISVESEPGQGSRFTITLPLEIASIMDTISRMKNTGRLPALKPEEATRKQTILLVEDAEETIMVVRDYLEYQGYKVEFAKNGIEGIAQAQKIRPDLILMDVQMPHMDGLEATRRLRAEGGFEHTPIIAFTALAMPGDRERCLEAGMDEYITKPVNLKALNRTLQTMLAARR